MGFSVKFAKFCETAILKFKEHQRTTSVTCLEIIRRDRSEVNLVLGQAHM